MKHYTSFLILLFCSIFSFAQPLKPISWEYGVSKSEVEKGGELELIFTASIDNNWYLYSSDFDPELGPMVTEFEFEDNDSYQLVGNIKPINPKEKYDEIWEGNYTYFKGKGEFRQKVKILESDPVISGLFSYQVCSDVDGKCIPFEEEFTFDQIQVLASNEATPQSAKPQELQPSSLSGEGSSSLSSQNLLQSDQNNSTDGVKRPVSWEVELDKKDFQPGDELYILFNATIEDRWHLYSTEIDIIPGPLPTEFEFNKNDTYELVGEAEPVDPKNKFDKIFEGEVEYFEGTGQIRQKIKVLKEDLSVSGTINFQVCNEDIGQCIPDEYDFRIGKESSEANGSESVEKAADGKVEKKGGMLTSRDPNDPYTLLAFMIVAFLAGLAAIFTPCVFPMIPMTVSFFTGKAKSRVQGIRNAIIYGISIVMIYTLVGAIVAPFMGPTTANEVATNEYLNIFFFLIFFVFALSFFGLFDINLPNSFVNKIDKRADQGGLIGVFFMAFTLVVVSFSCTGPIAGGLLFESAGGQVLKPILGMFSFGLAFAIPFTLFAIFPEWLNTLPKSGGWLNSVKVVLGFIELGFSLKFLSVADQVSHWGILDREVYLSIWIVILILLGIYLLGKIKLPHDSDLSYIPVPRFMLSIVVFSFAVYLIPGMWGAPLKSLSGYLPPITTQDLNLSQLLIERSYSRSQEESTLCEKPLYDDFLHLPHGLEGYFDYEQAVACSESKNKPIFIDFTGHGCVNCREMESKVWSDPRVLRILREDYIILALYVDDRTELPEDEWYTSENDGRLKNTIGRKNMDIEMSKFRNNAQPYYVLLGPDEEKLLEPIGYNLDIDEFVDYLEAGKKEFQEKFDKN